VESRASTLCSRRIGTRWPTTRAGGSGPTSSSTRSVPQTAFVEIVQSKGKGSPYLSTERRVPELILVLSSQLSGDVSHKPSGRLPLLSARPAVTLTTLKRAANNFTTW